MAMLAFSNPALKLLAKNTKPLGQLAENRVKTLTMTIRGIYKATLKLLAKNSKTLGQIAENTVQTLSMTIRCIL